MRLQKEMCARIMEHMKEPNTVNVTFSNRTIIRIVLVVTLSMLGLRFIAKVAHPLTLIFIAMFLSVALNPAVSWISKRLKSKSRIRATGVAYLIVVGILVGFLWLVVPPIAHQGLQFAKDLPTSTAELQSKDTPPARFIRRYHLGASVDKTADKVKNNLGDVGTSAFNTAGKVGYVIASIITVFVLTFMLLVEGPLWIDRLWRMQDPEHLPKRKRAVSRMYRVVTGYVNGQLLLALLAGTFAFLALLIASTLLGVSINAVVYACIVVFFGLIPLIGNMIAAALVVILCAFSSIPLAIIVAVYFVVYMQIENATLQPYIQSKQNELTPLLVLSSALIGASLAGLLGALIAIPAMGCLKVFITEFYGDRLNLGVTRKELDKSEKA
jgi:predicted PurR-regulated permease PerM